jgi:hypothetical protein
MRTESLMTEISLPFCSGVGHYHDHVENRIIDD